MAVTVGKFRVSGREVLLPVAADVFFFFASGGPISFNSERNGGKNAGKNYVFAFPRRAVAICKFAALSHAFTEPGRCRVV